MNLDLPQGVRLYGDPKFRGNCPPEAVEQVSIINKIRADYPDTWGLLVLHPRNEQLLERGQFSTVIKHRAEGMCQGAADLIIPASPSFTCEIKRQNPILSKWQDGQREFLAASAAAGAFACVALGAQAALSAFNDWLAHRAR